MFVPDRNMSHGNVGSQVERKERMDSAKFTVDRETTCPLLLRVFCSTSRHNSMSDYMKGWSQCHAGVLRTLLISFDFQVNNSDLTTPVFLTTFKHSASLRMK